MRKAFDANVPKLKPRLRPAMAVLSGATQENRNEDINITIEKAIPGTGINPQDEVLNQDFPNIPGQEPTANDTFTDTTDDDLPAETSLDTQGDEDATTPEAKADIDSTIVLIPDIIEINEEPPAQNNLQERIITLNEHSADVEVAETTPVGITSQIVQSIENLESTAIETQSGFQHTVSDPPAAPVLYFDDSDARRKRLENVKRKVSDAVRPEVRIEPVPEDPALAVESVLGLVSDLETQLSRSREVEKALRNELAEAKADLASTVNDGRTASGRLMQVEAQLDEKRNVLEEMLFEMGALEEERDQAVRMVQMLTIKDKDRQQESDNLRQRLAEMQRTVDENTVEEERLTGELDGYIKENTRLHTLLTEITKERDILVGNTERLTRECDDLREAKKALEKVHNALSQARARLRE
ncbi:MAG TPA: hypothetical protein VKO63_07185 [Chitinispirillaceae bacterium]|nr:hypothetical protein [Chitinispirillaceae bacterium]